MTALRASWRSILVWVARIVSGAAFVLSGWSKLIDPWGFVFKIEEYLAVWGVSDTFPREIVLTGAVALSLFEFIVGMLMMTGSLRRSAPCCGLLLMAFMLPLTAWIAIADPVSDCGCFGDLWVLSNPATFVKNLIITALLILALVWCRKARPLYRPGVQWLTIAATGFYGLVLALAGWQVQPLVDFRPFGIGKELVQEGPERDVTFIYSRDGQTREFPLDSLPDDSWEFVGRAGGAADTDNSLTIFDSEGEDVTDEVLAEPDSLLLIVVPEPGMDNLLRARYANEMAKAARERGIAVAALVAASDEALKEWIDLALPDYDVYSCTDTSLKQLVRGPIGLVYTVGGNVAWKINFANLDPDYLNESTDPFSEMPVVSDGRYIRMITFFYLAVMLVLLAISMLTKINFRKHTENEESTDDQ